MKKFFLVLVALVGMTGIVFAIGEETRNRIAIIGEDYNIYSYDLETAALQALTNDASRTRHYQWATWSNDGRLAYFCCDLSVASSFDSQAFISANGIDAGQLAYEGENESIIYAYWSPADCGTNCRELAMLINNERGLALEILRDGSNPETEQIAVGLPFYYHWDATGSQLVFHRNNNRIDIYNRAENDIQTSYDNLSSGTFQVPAWSPVDDRILVATDGTERGRSNLAILENGETQVLIENISPYVSFLWSPDGRSIAYRAYGREGVEGINVVDADTGELLASSDLDTVIAFFWSPDSRKIAYVTLAPERSRDAKALQQFIKPDTVQNDSPTEFQWSTLELETGENLRYSSFIPSQEMSYLLVYFEQFAPSHRLWSPDSISLVYAHIGSNSQGQISILDLETHHVEAIQRGVFAVWSFN